MIDYLEQGCQINSSYYADKLRWLRQETATKRQRKLTSGVLLFQDNAPARTSQVAMTAANECGYKILPHSPFSPNMAPSDYYMFPKLKSHLRGTHYGNNEGVIEIVNEYLEDPEKLFTLKG